jgi:hypothetical protein
MACELATRPGKRGLGKSLALSGPADVGQECRFPPKPTVPDALQPRYALPWLRRRPPTSTEDRFVPTIKSQHSPTR